MDSVRSDFEIDSESPQVFETSDYESEGSINATPSDRRSSIDQSEFTKDARDVFENYVLDSSKVDFSDSVIGKKSYESSHVTETYEQKVSRIRREIGELSMEESSKTDSDSLLSILDRLNINSTLVNHKPLHLEVERKTGDDMGISRSNKSLSVELDSRLNEMEKAIGIPDLLSNAGDISIQAELSKLHRQVNLLANPECLNDICRKVESSLSDKSKIDEKKDEMDEKKDEIDEKKIDLIYDRLTSLPRVDVVLPLALERLKSLNALHIQLGSSVNALDDLEESFLSLNKDIASWKDALESTEHKLEKERTDFEKNKTEIQQWVDDLRAKVESI